MLPSAAAPPAKRHIRWGRLICKFKSRFLTAAAVSLVLWVTAFGVHWWTRWHASKTVVLSSGFESGLGDYYVLVQKPRPDRLSWAYYDLTPAAALTGKIGLRVNVKKVPEEPWQIQLGSPKVQLYPSRLYTYCIWARLSRNSASAVVNASKIDLVSADTFNWITGTPPSTPDTPNGIVFTGSWQQLCLREFALDKPLKGFFVLTLGGAVAEYHLDDPSLVYQELDTRWGEPGAVAARIERHRKGDFTLRLQLPGRGGLVGGAPLPPSALRGVNVTLMQHDFLFGTAYDTAKVAPADRQWYADTAASLFNALSPDWSFKWPDYEPEPGQYQAAFDYINSSIIALAQAHGMRAVRGHTLEWFNEYEGVYDAHWSRKDGCQRYRAYLQERIERDVSLFRGKFNSYDVWNEVLHWRKWMDACDLWADTFKDAFYWAAEADPKAELCINEWDLVGSGVLDQDNRVRQMEALVRGLQSEKVPLHCLGIQAYIVPHRVNPAIVKVRLDALAQLGLNMYISEFMFKTGLDHRNRYYFDDADTPLAGAYERWMGIWFSHPAIKGMYVWGFWDAQLEIRNAGLYAVNKTAKPAAAAVAKLLKVTWNTSVTVRGGRALRQGLVRLRGFYGRYRVEAEGADGARYAGWFEAPAAGGGAQELAVVLAPVAGEAEAVRTEAEAEG